MFLNDNPIIVTDISNIVSYKPGLSFHRAPPSLPTYELQCCISGKNKIRFNGESIIMRPGMLLYLPKGTDNKEYTFYSSEDYDVYTIYFDTPSLMPQAPIIGASTPQIIHLFSTSFKTYVRKPDNYLYTCLKHFYSILEKISTSTDEYITPSQLSSLQPSIEYMQKHYCNKDFDYNEMHLRSGLSYTYYKELFIKKYGIPPVKQVTKLKLTRACELLSTQTLSISEVAKLCGFESVYYFSAVFKKHYGYAPKYYQK